MATALANDGAYSFDPRVAVEHVRASDPVLARVIDAVGPFRLQLKRAPSSFAALAEAIVYQQLSGRAAATIFARVCALFPRAPAGPTAEQVRRVSDVQLRGAGLSRAKLLSLRDLARKVADGKIPRSPRRVAWKTRRLSNASPWCAVSARGLRRCF